MRLFIKSKKLDVDACAEYDVGSKQFTVKKGSRVSSRISDSKTFRGAKTIENHRSKVVIDRLVVEDITFKSPSTAANFVLGTSSNGLVTWKDESNIALKDLLKEE